MDLWSTTCCNERINVQWRGGSPNYGTVQLWLLTADVISPDDLDSTFTVVTDANYTPVTLSLNGSTVTAPSAGVSQLVASPNWGSAAAAAITGISGIAFNFGATDSPATHNRWAWLKLPQTFNVAQGAPIVLPSNMSIIQFQEI